MTVHPLTEFRESHTPALSKAALARLIGVRRATVTRWEDGRTPDKKLWPKIHEVTGLRPSELGGFAHLEAAE